MLSDFAAWLLDLYTINKVDRQRMYHIYDIWADLAAASYNKDHRTISYDKIDHIVFAGMGGSGAIGDLFSSILSKTDTHVDIVKGYHLPKTADSDTLVVAISISGNTAETLNVLKSAVTAGCNVVAFSSGGVMERFCTKKNIEYRKIPMVHSPRASYITYVYEILGILNSAIPVKKHDIIQSLNTLEKISTKINSQNLTVTNPSLQLAMWLDGISLIYYPWGLQAAAVRFKNSLQENAKSHAMIEDVIEASHNGIVSWERPSQVKPVLIQGTDDYIKTKQRWKILEKYFEQNHIEYRKITSQQGSILAKLVCLVYLLDYASIYAAILYGVDPSPVRSINYIKNSLK